MSQKVTRQEVFTQINTILAEWDPIGVGSDIASDEYYRYVSDIVQAFENGENIYYLLKDIVGNQMELGFDETNDHHVQDLKNVMERILGVLDQ